MHRSPVSVMEDPSRRELGLIIEEAQDLEQAVMMDVFTRNRHNSRSLLSGEKPIAKEEDNSLIQITVIPRKYSDIEDD